MSDSEFQIPNSKSEQSEVKKRITVPLGKMRVLLWDIDGTLMSSTVHGAFKKYFAPVMKEIYGSAGALADLQVSGMTDTQIFYEALKDEGFTPERILAAKDKLLPVFKKAMADVIGKTEKPYELKPGAREILQATSENPRFLNALLTGNLSVAAEIKLRYFDLWKYFENAPNIFGEVSCDRREMGRAALQIVGEYFKAHLNPEQFIVIGDTPNDIAAARAFGAKMVSVATDKNHPAEELAKYEPDRVLDDLSDTREVLRLLETV